MGKILINSGGGGNLSDDTTALLSDIVKDKTALTSDSNDEVGTGTLELTGNSDTDDVLNGCTFYKNNPHNKLTGTLSLTGNAPVNYVYKGKTFYNNNAKNKLTGTLTCNSISNFSVTVNSGRRVLCSWKNPTQASGKPYSGVYIKYSTSGYPGTGGTQIYKGSGSNTVSGGTSTVYVNLPNISTRYYLSIYPYVTCSAGEIRGSVLNAQVTTGGTINRTFTSSSTYIIPQGYTLLDIFCVGGGGGGSRGHRTSDAYGGGGGGGGYTTTVNNISVSAGQSLAIVVGSGGIGVDANHSGGGSTSSVTRSGSVLCSANGGDGGYYTSIGRQAGGDGGSGGGGGGGSDSKEIDGGNGGSNGGDGYTVSEGSQINNPDIWEYGYCGYGQKTTTRAWGSSSGTLYSGGGGAGGYYRGTSNRGAGGAGGAGGGGAGTGAHGSQGTIPTPQSGSANTGGGGGGAGGYYGSRGGAAGATGGSGIVLIRLH